MRICFIPIDNRPVCYNLVEDICRIDRSIELFMPPREYLGDLTKTADVDKIFEWFSDVESADVVILSLDTIAYGGLVPSRRSQDSKEIVLERVEKFREEWNKKNAKIYALSSIMRISNNNYNEEEKEYWKDYGEKIFRWSYETSQSGQSNVVILQEILDDYLTTRERNFEINKIFLEWQKGGEFEELVFTKDDCAEFGLNIDEARVLEGMGGRVITGADEVPISLLSKSITGKMSVKPIFVESDTSLKSNYEDVSIEDSVKNQLRLADVDITDEAPDIVMVVNNFKVCQGEIVMERATEQFCGEFRLPKRPYMVADVRNANGADNNFVEHILPQIRGEDFYGYSAWNTSANAIGTLICVAKIRFLAKDYDDNAFRMVQLTRFLDDWGYQANVRQELKKRYKFPKEIRDKDEVKTLMRDYEERVRDVLGLEPVQIEYGFPWGRFFEIEIGVGVNVWG